jgi:hypothetical protein
LFSPHGGELIYVKKFLESGRLVRTGAALLSLNLAAILLTSALVPPSAAAPPSAPPVTAAQKAKGQQVTAELERLLRQRVSSPGGKLTLRLTPGARADRGEFTEIFATGRPAQVRKLRITEMTLRARNVRISPTALLQQKEIRTLTSDTSLRAVVTEDDLTNLLARGKHTREMGLKIKFNGDRIRVAGNFHWGWFSGPVVGVGKLRLGSNYKVYFDIVSLQLNGAEVPAFIKGKFSDRINPVIDYEDIPFRPRFKSLQFNGKSAILTA